MQTINISDYYHGYISILTCSWEASDCEGSRDFKTSSDPLRQYTDPCCCPLEEIPATLSKGNCRDFSLSSTTSRPCKNQSAMHVYEVNH